MHEIDWNCRERLPSFSLIEAKGGLAVPVVTTGKVEPDEALKRSCFRIAHPKMKKKKINVLVPNLLPLPKREFVPPKALVVPVVAAG